MERPNPKRCTKCNNEKLFDVVEIKTKNDGLIAWEIICVVCGKVVYVNRSNNDED